MGLRKPLHMFPTAGSFREIAYILANRRVVSTLRYSKYRKRSRCIIFAMNERRFRGGGLALYRGLIDQACWLVHKVAKSKCFCYSCITAGATQETCTALDSKGLLLKFIRVTQRKIISTDGIGISTQALNE